MSRAITLDRDYVKSGDLELPQKFEEINGHNLYLYVKSYLASVRSNGAMAKTRSDVKGGGKKPWAQKGGGRARAGSITSPIFVGGGKAHGPSNNKNYNLKVNKKQIKLALKFALKEKAKSGRLYVVDHINIESGKSKDAYALFKKLNERSTLFCTQACDEKTFLSFRNLKDCYLISENELNAYLVSTFASVVIERSLFDKIVNEG